MIAGALDFAICNRPASQTELKLRLLHRNRVILVSGPTKKLTPWKPCRLAHMPDLKLVLPSSQHSLRRVLDKRFDPDQAMADVMTAHPKTIRPRMLAAEAVHIMETSRITALPVIDDAGVLVGALNVHDLLRAGVM